MNISRAKSQNTVLRCCVENKMSVWLGPEPISLAVIQWLELGNTAQYRNPKEAQTTEVLKYWIFNIDRDKSKEYDSQFKGTDIG